jgi:hypothetical protein
MAAVGSASTPMFAAVKSRNRSQLFYQRTISLAAAKAMLNERSIFDMDQKCI